MGNPPQSKKSSREPNTLTLACCFSLVAGFHLASFIRTEAINHISVCSPTGLRTLWLGWQLHWCTSKDGETTPTFSLLYYNCACFPDFAIKLNTSFGTPRNAVKPSLAEMLMRRILRRLLQKPCRLTIWPPKANSHLEAGKPTLLRKAFATPQPLSWTSKLLCPHTQGQNNEFSCCTQTSYGTLCFWLTCAKARSQERDTEPWVAIVIQNLF